MSILMSPSNSTGWGLGVANMYGGALTRQGLYTVQVRGYYRRPWGSVRKSTSAEMDDTIESVVRSARRYRRGRRRRAAASGDSIASAIESVVRGARRYASRRDRAIDATINSVVRSARRYSRASRSLLAARRVARSAARRARTARWRRIHRGIRIRRSRT